MPKAASVCVFVGIPDITTNPGAIILCTQRRAHAHGLPRSDTQTHSEECGSRGGALEAAEFKREGGKK